MQWLCMSPQLDYTEPTAAVKNGSRSEVRLVRSLTVHIGKEVPVMLKATTDLRDKHERRCLPFCAIPTIPLFETYLHKYHLHGYWNMKEVLGFMNKVMLSQPEHYNYDYIPPNASKATSTSSRSECECSLSSAAPPNVSSSNQVLTAG